MEVIDMACNLIKCHIGYYEQSEVFALKMY